MAKLAGKRRWPGVPHPRGIVAGLVNAVASVPDGLASAALAGVNPVLGLYTCTVAPIAGSLLSSSQLMQIATTSASAIAAAQAIASYPENDRAAAMALLVLLVGGLLALLGLLRAGRLVRFVSHAVMTGFLTGVAVALVMNQLGPFLGVSPEASGRLAQFVEILTHPSAISLPNAAVGLAALAIILALAKTPLSRWSAIIALAAPTALVAIGGWHSVVTIGDVSPIPPGFPLPKLPDFRLISLELAGSAFAIAVIIAIQGAGVSQSTENPDDSPVDASRDILAEGASNLAAGLFAGIPAGGSVGQTALNVSVGAASRWAGIFHGAWMAVFVLLLPHLVARVPMAVLAALMIFAGLGALNWREALSIWRTGGGARWAIVVTFAASLITSIPMAVAIGILLTVFFHLLSSATDVAVRTLSRHADGKIYETDPPAHLPSNEATVIEVYGSLFFAGARTLAERLPKPEDAEAPVAILRLRGRSPVGATLIEVLDDYADRLADVGGRLYLSGVGDALGRQLQRVGKLEFDRNVRIFRAEAALGDSTQEAINDAARWLGSRRLDPPLIRP